MDQEVVCGDRIRHRTLIEFQVQDADRTLGVASLLEKRDGL